MHMELMLRGGTRVLFWRLNPEGRTLRSRALVGGLYLRRGLFVESLPGTEQADQGHAHAQLRRE